MTKHKWMDGLGEATYLPIYLPIYLLEARQAGILDKWVVHTYTCAWETTRDG